MMNKNLNNSFWNKIRTLIKLYHLNFLYDIIGSNYLSDEEMKFLEDNLGKSKIDTSKIPLLDKIFAFGQVSQQIGLENANKITNKDLEEWLKENKVESNTQLQKIKSQAYLDVLSKQFRIEKELRQGVLNISNKNKFKMSDIVDFIKNKFEDWSYLKDSISYVSESALNEGKVEEIKKQNEIRGGDIYVMKVPVLDEKLCPHCRRLYLNTDGTPKLFKLSELEANGINIGLKPSEWKATISQTHPHCRCLLQYMESIGGTTIEDYKFDEEKQRYILKEDVIKDENRKVQRKSKVKITIGEKEFEV